MYQIVKKNMQSFWEHLWGFVSFVCSSLWTRNKWFLWKDLSQISQKYCLTSWVFLTCFFKLYLLANLLPHWSHLSSWLHGFKPSWLICLWRFKWAFLVKSLSQRSHLNGLWPVWDSMWVSRRLGLEKVLLQPIQRWKQDFLDFPSHMSIWNPTWRGNIPVIIRNKKVWIFVLYSDSYRVSQKVGPWGLMVWGC